MISTNSCNWIKLRIGDIADVVAGGTPKASDPDNFEEPGKGIAWLTPADLSGYTDKYISFGARDLSRQGYESSSAKILPKGSLLFSSRAPIGYVAIAKNEISTSQGFKNFIFPYGVDSDYAYYYLRSIKDIAENMGTGTTFKEISGTITKTLPFMLPPLAEQKIIADKLDILLAQVENTKNRLERIPDILKKFHQSVLAAAVSGKLTEGWRGHKRYSQNGYPDNWTELGFSDIGELSRGKSKHRPRNDPRLFGNKYPFIQTGEVANSNGYILNAKQYYSEFGLSQSKLFPKGTLCITIAANIADTSILGIDACFPDSVVGFIPRSAKCEVLFVKYLIDVNKSNLEDFAPSTAQKNINLKILNAMKFPFPPLEEQSEIVRRVEELFAFADRVEQKAIVSLKHINSLTQSILAKAFRGELTADWRATNPELISGENSAEALLKKIKAEREAIKKQPRLKRPAVKKNIGSPMSKQIIKVVEALKKSGESLSGQQLLAAAGYPNNSNTEQLEQFFLDIRDALAIEKSIVKLERSDDGQDWFALAKATDKE